MDFAVDLETLGMHCGCAILSIGVVAFDPYDEKYDDLYNSSNRLYVLPMLKEQLEDGLYVDADTLAFWNKQSDRSVITNRKNKEHTLDGCFGMFSSFVVDNGNDESRLFSIGNDFDVAMLRWLYNKYNHKWPFKYNAARDVRTVCDICDFDRKGFHVDGLRLHNSLDDAVYAAACIKQCRKKLKRMNV